MTLESSASDAPTVVLLMSVIDDTSQG